MEKLSRLKHSLALAVAALALCATPLVAFAAASGTAASKTKTITSVHKPAAALPAAVPTFADSTKDDDGAYDDQVVREAAIEGLGRYNGSVVALDPNTGRILTIVNQKLAFSSGFIPCSTIKPVIAVAALEENVINRDSMIEVAPRRYLNLVEALAHSNNAFFEELGRRMGFDTISHYARLLGLGELSGYNLPEEQPGAFPAGPPQRGGVARMSSFGEGIQITPLQLGSLASTLANGGTIYYLQYPHSEQEKENFVPKVKRRLDIASLVPDIRDGMLAAVLYGTAHLSYDGQGEQPLGKTGTCNDTGSRIGWFTSYADQAHPKIVLVVLMRGQSRVITGPMAAGIAGRIYRRLDEVNYFAPKPGASAVSVPAPASRPIAAVQPASSASGS